MSRAEKVKWLKQHIREGPKQGPYRSCMKFMELQELLEKRFGSLTNVDVTKVISDAFPEAEKDRSTYLIGIRPFFPPHGTPDILASPSPSVVSPATSAGILSLPSTSTGQTSPIGLVPEVEKLWSDKSQLEARVSQLEREIQALQSSQQHSVSVPNLEEQIDKLMSSNSIIIHGPNTNENFEAFSIRSIQQELQRVAPDLHHLFNTLGKTRNTGSSEGGELADEEVKALVALCTLLNCRSRRAKGLQLFLSIMLVARTTSKQAMIGLNHAGVCLSYDATWNHLKTLVQESDFLSRVKQGHWIWIYDNFNINLTVRHERVDHHSTMSNTTTRLALQITQLPTFEFSWSDVSPQKLRHSLTQDELLPNATDGRRLYDRAVVYIMRLMVEHFPALSGLKHLLPCQASPTATKSTIMPMPMLFMDEKYTAENMRILRKYVEDCNLSGDPQVVVGDQSTCRNIRGAKRWAEGEIVAIDQLKWANEVPGDFHFVWECLKVLFLVFWGKPTYPGSLCNLRDYISRKRVDKTAKTFNTADEFLIHCFKAHLMVAVCTELGIQSPEAIIPHDKTQEWLCTTAKKIVERRIMPAEPVDPVTALNRSFLYIGFLYCDLRHAIRYEEGEDIIRHWKHWLVLFLGTNRTQYSGEALNMLCNLKATYPKHIAYIVTHNRTVNTTGIAGHGKPIDQMLEHYNLVIKQALRASGANVTKQHMVTVSMTGLLLLEMSRRVDEQLQLPVRSGHHTVQDAQKDIVKMTTYLMEENITNELSSRPHGLSFQDPFVKGSEKISKGEILKYISKSELDDVSEVELPDPTDDTLDLEYELYHTD